MSSPLYQKIQDEVIVALKAKEELKASTLRYLISAIKNRIIELRPLNKELDDSEVISLISKQIKQRKESIVEFEKGGRKDLADKEAAEMKLLEAYLPQQMTEDEIRALVDSAVAESGAKMASDMGKVMAILVPKTKGKADGALVSKLVKEKLS
jgi:uncharacterized protein YqeY